MAPGEALEVPIFWLWAEKTAQDLIVAGAGDMRLARDAWRWLQRGRLLAGPALTDATCRHGTRPMVGIALCVALSRARRILNGTPPHGC